MYRIDILTLFDLTVGDVLSESILGRAQERDILRIEAHQIRDYTLNKQKLFQCWKHVVDEFGPGHTIYFSPAGTTFKQADAKRLAADHNHLILVCGHYEGIDERFIEECVDEEISLGDFVLTGGEIPAMAVSDAVCRLIPGVLSDPECFEDESHWNGLLEYPQYSRPEEWHGKKVPSILLSGNHALVSKWRRKQAILRTKRRRPDMYKKLNLTSTKEDLKIMKELQEEYPDDFPS